MGDERQSRFRPGYGSEWHLLRYLGRHRADFPELAALAGDGGAGASVERNRAWHEVVRVDDPGIHFDIDTPGDLAAE